MNIQNQDRDGWQSAQLQRQHGKGGKPPPPAEPIPPVTESSSDVVMERRAQRQGAANRKGYLSTLLAGADPQAQANEKKNLLG